MLDRLVSGFEDSPDKVQSWWDLPLFFRSSLLQGRLIITDRTYHIRARMKQQQARKKEQERRRRERMDEEAYKMFEDTIVISKITEILKKSMTELFEAWFEKF